jgi:hypothetical protein
LLGEVRYRAVGKTLSFAAADVRKLGGLAPDEAAEPGREAPRDDPPPKWVRAVVVRRQLGWGLARVQKAGLRGTIRTQTVGKAVLYSLADVERILADRREVEEFAAQYGVPLAKRR